MVLGGSWCYGWLGLEIFMATLHFLHQRCRLDSSSLQPPVTNRFAPLKWHPANQPGILPLSMQWHLANHAIGSCEVWLLQIGLREVGIPPQAELARVRMVWYGSDNAHLSSWPDGASVTVKTNPSMDARFVVLVVVYGAFFLVSLYYSESGSPVHALPTVLLDHHAWSDHLVIRIGYEYVYMVINIGSLQYINIRLSQWMVI